MSAGHRTGALAIVLGVVLGLSALVPAASALPAELALPTQPSPSTLPAEPTSGELVTEITDVTQVVNPGDDLAVTVKVRNRGEEPIEDVALELRFRSAQLISRSSLEMWEALDEGEIDELRPSGTVITRARVDELKPGDERTATLKISSDKLFLPRLASQWGPRGIAVDSKIGDDIVERQRTFFIWFPTEVDQVFPTQVSILAPLVGTPPGGEGGAAEGERLQKVLDATRNAEVSYAVDPYLLTGTETEITSAQLRDATEGREVFTLPNFDADVSALAHVEELSGFDYLKGARATISAQLDTSASDVLLWPEGNADGALGEFAARYESQGVGAIITAPQQLEPAIPLTYTPTGKARVETENSVVSALIPDAAMSATLTAAATEGVRTSTALARQRLLAESAVITQERPADARHVLLTVPRNWNPDPARSRDLLKALNEAPWVELEAVRTLIGSPAGEFEREPLPTFQQTDNQIEAETVLEAQSAHAQLTQFRSIIDQPELVFPLADVQLKGIVANGWRHSPDERSALVEQIAASAAELQEMVAVIPAGTVNLVTDSGEIPVLIHNAFTQEVTVSVRLATDSSFLKTSKPVVAQLPPESETSILIPVEAIGNRDVDVAVHLENSEGQQVGAPQTITVRVRAGWEDAGTRVAVVVLVVLFVIGIFRTIRRGRKRNKS